MTAPRRSAGLLLYRWGRDGPEVLLAHPGGPFWAKKDAGAWTIPKGELKPDEDALAAARREFEEETGIRASGPFLDLGEIRQKAGKVVQAWASGGDADPARIVSNTVRLEWPRGSGRWLEFPEIDRGAWFGMAEAKRRINPAQALFLDRLAERIGEGGEGA